MMEEILMNMITMVMLLCRVGICDLLGYNEIVCYHCSIRIYRNIRLWESQQLKVIVSQRHRSINK